MYISHINVLFCVFCFCSNELACNFDNHSNYENRIYRLIITGTMFTGNETCSAYIPRNCPCI